MGSGQPALGASYLLPAYAAVFLGATTVKPGQFNVWGTVVAAYLLGAGVAGLQQLGMQTYVQDFFNGGALVIAVAASVLGDAPPRRRNRLGLRLAAQPAWPCEGPRPGGSARTAGGQRTMIVELGLFSIDRSRTREFDPVADDIRAAFAAGGIAGLHSFHMGAAVEDRGDGQ